MPIPELLGLTRLAKPLTSAEGNRILERDRYRCQYCGLDGLASFENSLIMTVDFLHPRARKGKKAVSYTHLDVYKRQILKEPSCTKS